ncbi:MAG: TonB-dependent receptor [Bacteroidales bacterium]|nr:TonB-dependent receptor [Bacteroidales bacterium]
MKKIYLILFILTSTIFIANAQYKMDISVNYNIPQSDNFSNDFKNGWGASGEVHYFFKESGFSASVLFGLQGFRANKSVEDELIDTSLIFDYDYQVHYFSFPLFIRANYTFFQKSDFNIMLGFGIGGVFMEHKEKQIGKHTSDTNIDKFNEFGIYPSLGLSYKISSDISIIISSGLNITLGEKKVRYIDIKTGLIYTI